MGSCDRVVIVLVSKTSGLVPHGFESHRLRHLGVYWWVFETGGYVCGFWFVSGVWRGEVFRDACFLYRIGGVFV